MASTYTQPMVYDFNDIDNQDMVKCFAAFDSNKENRLSLSDFKRLCYSLFVNAEKNQYLITEKEAKEMFDVFDLNKDNYIAETEFKLCWEYWVSVIIKPRCALLVIDVQNDFISGTMDISKFNAKHNAVDIIEPINKLLHDVKFDNFYYTMDWHPDNHISFIDNVKSYKVHKKSAIQAEEAKPFDVVLFEGPPQLSQRLWPKHCVQDTWGAELHKDLYIHPESVIIYKGTNPCIDSYSAFWDNEKVSETALRQYLQDNNITDVYCCGLCADCCVGLSILDSLSFGFRTVLIEDCSRAINKADVDTMKDMIINNRGAIVQLENVKNMVEGVDRRPEMGILLANQLRKHFAKEIVAKQSQTNSEGSQ